MPFTLYLKSLLERFLENEQGAELAEYAVGVALLVAIAVVVFQALGDTIVDKNSGTGASDRVPRGLLRQRIHQPDVCLTDQGALEILLL